MPKETMMESNSTTLSTADLLEFFAKKIKGQPNTAQQIVPFVQTYRAGLKPEHRPIAVLLLLGPTGTGKTRTVEVLAEALHGSPQKYLRIDCGEFQMDHEVAKLIGAPPGYLGHRETVPALSKQKLEESITPECDISLILFDEIEKAAPSMTRLLLGVLDKGRLTLADNTTVHFDKSLIFLTSNLGAHEMMRELSPGFGFGGSTNENRVVEAAAKLESIALAAVRKKFSPEFVNRIDAVITYKPLTVEAIQQILSDQIEELQQHVTSRLGEHGFAIEVTDTARQFLFDSGFSAQYGARELKRTVYRHLTQPLATLVAESQVPNGATVVISAVKGAPTLNLTVRGEAAGDQPGRPAVLIVDDNHELLKFLNAVMKNEGWDLISASSGRRALEYAEGRKIDVGLIDYMLPDMDGLALIKKLQARLPEIKVILMTGGGEMSFAPQNPFRSNIPIVQKPFLVDELLALVRSRLPDPSEKQSASAAH